MADVALDTITLSRSDDGIDAINIEISQSWNGNVCTLTANVFMGGKQLSDTEVIALGALKWYANGTFISNGKTLTRTVTSRETLECRLESGGWPNA